MANTFRLPWARKEYEAVLMMYEYCHQNLFHSNGARNRSNGVGEMFWRGYEGVGAQMWDQGSKKLVDNIRWRAGQDVAKTVGAMGTQSAQ
jgi:hypothetical protein